MNHNTDNTTDKNPSASNSQGSNTADQSSQTQSIEPRTINEPLHASDSSTSNMNETMPSPNSESQSSNSPSPLTSQVSESSQGMQTADAETQPIQAVDDTSTPADILPQQDNLATDPSAIPGSQINTSSIDNNNQNPSPATTQQSDQLPNVVSNKQSGSKYTIVLTILAIFAIAGIAFAGYQFYQNSQQDGSEVDTISEQTREIEVFVPEILADNGNIVTTLANGETRILFDKSEFETAGIMGFSDLIMSPDGSAFCFHTKPPAPVSAIYVSDLSGENFKEVGRSRTGCRWLNSNSIAYLNTPSGDSGVDIFMYSMQGQTEIILTSQEQPVETRFFSIRGIDNNGETILCSVSLGLNTEPVDCTINTQTMQVTIAGTPPASEPASEAEDIIDEE